MEKHEKIGIYDGIKGWCAALGLIGAGVAFYLGPGDIAEKLPLHREIGIATGALGGLFALALLFHGTEFGFRMQSLVLCIAGVSLAGLVAYAIGPRVHAAWRLSSDGVEAQAVVTQVKIRHGRNGTSYRYVVEHPGGRATIEMTRGARKGARVPVLYLRDDPDVVLAGRADDPFLTLLDKSIGRWWAIGGGGFALILVLLALVKLKHFLLGRGNS